VTEQAVAIGDVVTHPLGDWVGEVVYVGEDAVNRWVYDESGLVLHQSEGAVMLVRVTQHPAPGWR
jgi:hypothetical protein